MKKYIALLIAALALTACEKVTPDRLEEARATAKDNEL